MLWAIFVFRLIWALLLSLVACVIGPLLLIHHLSNATHGQGTTFGQGQTRRGFTGAWALAANAWTATAKAAERARGIVPAAAPVSTKTSDGGL